MTLIEIMAIADDYAADAYGAGAYDEPLDYIFFSEDRKRLEKAIEQYADEMYEAG